LSKIAGIVSSVRSSQTNSCLGRAPAGNSVKVASVKFGQNDAGQTCRNGGRRIFAHLHDTLVSADETTGREIDLAEPQLVGAEDTFVQQILEKRRADLPACSCLVDSLVA